MDFLDLNAPKKKDDSLGVGIGDEKISSADDFYSGDFDFLKPQQKSSDSQPSYQNTYNDGGYSSAPTYQSGNTTVNSFENQNTYSVDSIGSYSNNSIPQQNTYSGANSNTYQNTYSTDAFASNNQNTYSGNSSYNSMNSTPTNSQFYRDSASTELHVLGELEKISKAIESAEWILIISGVLLAIVSFAGSLSGLTGAIIAILNFIDVCICLGLAFGISKKNKACAICAIIYGGLGVLVNILSLRRIFIKVFILGTFITAYQKINRYHQLKAKHEFDSDDRIASYFRKEPASFKIRHLAMIIALILALIGGITGILKVASSVGGTVSSAVATSDISNWKRVNIGDGEGVSILMPTEPRKTVLGSDTTYSADGLTSFVIARHGDGMVEGYTQKQKEAIAQKLLEETIYTEIHSETGEDSNGYYAYRVFKIEEDGDSVIMCIKVMILEEDVVLVNYSIPGDDYSGKVKENAEEYFSKIYRTY